MKKNLKVLLVLSIIFCMALSNLAMPVIASSYPARGYEMTSDQKAIVDRAFDMYNTTWTAKKNVYGWNNYLFKKGTTYRIPYGQPVNRGQYIGFACSISSFVSYANNVNSKMYTSSSAYGSKTSTFYANDCSAFVSYAWGISRHTTAAIPNVSTSLGTDTTKLRIGDCLNKPNDHVILVTNIIKKSTNANDIVEVIEQTPPQMKKSTYTKAELKTKYLDKGYTIRRKKGISVSDKVIGGNNGTSQPGGNYFPKYTGSSSSLVDALNAVGANSSFDYRKKIAAKNGISNYTGTSSQNTQLLNLLKQGKLLKPDGTQNSVTYFPKYTGSSSSLVDGLKAVGASTTFDYRKQIAAKNGISNYTGTSSQNTKLLNLLKQGKLIKP
jgi:hypothetical protein